MSNLANIVPAQTFCTSGTGRRYVVELWRKKPSCNHDKRKITFVRQIVHTGKQDVVKGMCDTLFPGGKCRCFSKWCARHQDQ